MASSTITGPDGAKYTVSHPASATDEEVLAYAQQQIASGNLQPISSADSGQPPATWSENVAQADLASRSPAMEALGETGRFVGDVASNLPGSAMNMVGGLVNAVLSPIDTAEMVGRTALGGAEKLGRNISNLSRAAGITTDPNDPYALVEPGPNEPLFDAVIDNYANTYGSVEGFTDTLREDPVSVLLDVVPAAAAVGKATKVSPITGTAKALEPKAQDLARGIRRSEFFENVKPSTRLGGDARRADLAREELWRTADEFDISPDDKGLARLRGEMVAIDNQVDALISDVDELTPASKLLDGLDDTRARADRNLSTGAPDRAAAQAVEDRITESITSARGAYDDAGIPRNPYSEELTPREVQKFKRDMYRDIDWQNRDRTALNEADIDVAQAARGALEEMSPELGAVNRDWGRLLDLEETLVPALNRMSNRHAGPAAWMSGFSQPLWLLQEGGRVAGKASPGVAAALSNPAVAALTQAGWLEDILEKESEANIPYLYD